QCHDSLFDYADAAGGRDLYWPLAEAIFGQLPQLPAWNNEPTMSTNHIDVICLSHLRWNFVFQRPQHLMTRFARTRRVFFFEEPIFDGVDRNELRVNKDGNVFVTVPHLTPNLSPESVASELRRLLNEFVAKWSIAR